MKANWFNEDLKEGEKWERIALQELQFLFPHTALVKEGQRNDIGEKPHTITYEIKTRGHRYCCDDIAFETISVVEAKKEGWYYRSNADVLIYHWLNEGGTRSEKLYVLGLKKLRRRNFLEEVVRKYGLQVRETESNGGMWHTKFYLVPIRFIPADCIIRGKPLAWQYTLDDNFEKALWNIVDRGVANEP